MVISNFKFRIKRGEKFESRKNSREVKDNSLRVPHGGAGIVPALITSAIFSFIWRWDDYLSALLYVNRASMRPVSLALQLFNDPSSGSDIGSTLAMSTLSIVPATIIFLVFQKSLVEGIASTGIKG